MRISQSMTVAMRGVLRAPSWKQSQRFHFVADWQVQRHQLRAKAEAVNWG